MQLLRPVRQTYQTCTSHKLMNSIWQCSDCSFANDTHYCILWEKLKKRIFTPQMQTYRRLQSPLSNVVWLGTNTLGTRGRIGRRTWRAFCGKPMSLLRGRKLRIPSPMIVQIENTHRHSVVLWHPLDNITEIPSANNCQLQIEEASARCELNREELKMIVWVCVRMHAHPFWYGVPSYAVHFWKLQYLPRSHTHKPLHKSI
jgi:hypothetical protein